MRASSNPDNLEKPRKRFAVKKTLSFLTKTTVVAAAGVILSADQPIGRPVRAAWEAESIFSGGLPENSIEKTISPEERRNHLFAQISELVEPIFVAQGDIPSRLVAKSGLSAQEFWTLNSFLGYGDGTSNPKLHIGDTFMIPKNAEDVRGYLAMLSRMNHSQQLKDAVESGKTVKELKKIVRVSPFPSEVECVGMAETLEAMVSHQEAEIDPKHPSVVDPRIEHTASCANLIKYLYIHSCNLKYYSERQRRMLLTEGLDAWILPKRLYADFGYEQRYREFMDDFNFANITAFDPIYPEKREAYREKFRALYAELKEGKIPTGSLIPLFFKHSKSKGKVQATYSGVALKDKHMNTHQTIFVRNATMTFSASDIPTIALGKRVPFGKEGPHRKELEARVRAQSVLVRSLGREIISALSEERNPELFKSPNPEKARFRELFQREIESGKFGKKTFSQGETDFTKNPLDAFGVTISRNPLIIRLTAKYLREKHVANLLEDELSWYAKPAQPIAEQRSAIDLLVNFIVNRADFGGSFSEGFRGEVLAGIKTYPEFFDLKVNGRAVDIAYELEAIKNGKGLVILPTDTISISGPMSIDGEIRSMHQDPKEQKIMSARTRFVFEFVGGYLPTEVAVPGPDVIKRRSTIATPASNLSFRKTYDLKSGETIEQVLFERIAEFEEISPADPKRQEKILWNYQYQIRGLMLDGFMRSENELNPSSTVPNRPIPYYDRKSVIATWPRHIDAYYESKNVEQEQLDSDILEFPIISGGGITTPKELFLRLSQRVAGSEQQYPILRKIKSFNEFQKLYFVDQAYRRSRKDAKARTVFEFFRSREHNRTFFFSVSDIAKLVKEITSLSVLASPVLKPIDEEIIDSVVESEQEAALIKNTLFIETYGNDALIQKRQLYKWATESHRKSVGIYQIRFDDLDDADIHEWVLRAYRGNLIAEPLSQPTRQDMLTALDIALSSDALERGKEFFDRDADGMKKLYQDAIYLKRVRDIFQKNEASKEEVREAYHLLRKVSRFDIMWEKPFLGKYFGTAFLVSKYRKHFENVTYWVQKVGIPFEDLAENDELRFQYERTLIFVNNQSETSALLMLSSNYMLRLLEWLEVPIDTKNIYRKPNSLYEKIKQSVANQIYFDKELYLEHFDFHLDQLGRRLSAERRLASMGDASIDARHILLLERIDTMLRSYRDAMRADPRKINSLALDIFRNQDFQEILESRKLSPYPFVTDEEVRSDNPFRSSAFNYISKMIKANSRPKNAPGTGTLLQKFYNEKIAGNIFQSARAGEGR